MPKEITLYVLTADGHKYQCTVPVETEIRNLAADFFDLFSIGKNKSVKFIVDLLDYPSKGDAKRLLAEKTIGEYGLKDGDMLRIFPESIAGCFWPDTKISLGLGKTKTIEEIVLGDEILTFGENRFQMDRVVGIYKAFADEHILVNENLHVTPSHLMVSNNQVVPAENLIVGDELFDVDGSVVKVYDLEVVRGTKIVYNLTLEKELFIYANQILVGHDFEKSNIFFTEGLASQGLLYKKMGHFFGSGRKNEKNNLERGIGRLKSFLNKEVDFIL